MVSVIVVSWNSSVGRCQILLAWTRAPVIVWIRGRHVQIGRASPAGVHVVVKRAILLEQNFPFIARS